MAGYEIYPLFPKRDHRLKPFPAPAACEPPAASSSEDPPEGDPFTLLYKLIDGKMEMVLVRQQPGQGQR